MVFYGRPEDGCATDADWHTLDQLALQTSPP